MNDVDQGGGTAFTSLGISVKPVKGSAVLWFNFYADGREDFMTYHGGCPVMFGAKWAANKWIRYGSQFLNLKCGLKPKDRVRFAVNKG
ncbi:unnamed protein product [Allacma fusca]|uniref:Prolyl 4-hydroxylase alpha subunit Fe(2+) 2OG dioxygenase domain-containing protein n=1 Tax=Allacma fusca TaxID=39272 RepID=A0A8J2LNM9_9HEXA|nr:unnamed protein product [Allacma fusca]